MFNANQLRVGVVRAQSPIEERPDTVVNSKVAVQLSVSWDDGTLLVRELLAGQEFTLGSEVARPDAIDFALASEALGCERCVLIRWSGTLPLLHIAEQASGEVSVEGEGVYTLDQLREQQIATAEGHELALCVGTVAKLQWAGLKFEVACGLAQAPWSRSLGGSEFKTLAGYIGASAVSAAALLAGMAFFVPPLGLNPGEQLDTDRIYLLQQYLDAAAEREQEPPPAPAAQQDEAAGGQAGARAAADEGALGKADAPKAPGKLAVKGDAAVAERQLSAYEEAQTFGMIGILSAGVERLSVSAPWARDAALGSDPLDAQGAMWGDELKDSFGSGGLGLSGLGEGGGLNLPGIGLGRIGTIGSFGNCLGEGCNQHGFGRSLSRVPTGHAPRTPVMRMSQPTVTGRLPPQTIQRIVRQNFGRFRQCYDKGLQANPNLQGRVEVRFLINSAGTVSAVSNGGSTLPNSAVVGCVVQAFYGLSFPKPENGNVQVSYPIFFTPG